MNPGQECLDRIIQEQDVAGPKFSQDATQRPNVDLLVVLHSQDYLWRSIRSRLHVRRQMIVGEATRPKIYDLHITSRVGLDEDVFGLTQGLATLIGPKGVKLSGGQLQRVAAARMFIRQPELLVFDDISSALDINTERLLWSRLLADKGKTILAVSHREAVLQQADQVISLVPSSVNSNNSTL